MNSTAPSESTSRINILSESRISKPIAWTNLGALILGHFAVDFCTGIWPIYKTIAHLDVTKAGLIATIGSLTANGLQAAFGILADRGLRNILLVAGVLLACSVLCIPYVNSYSSMALLMLITSIGSAAFHPSGTGSASSLAGERKGLVVAIFLAGGYLGYAISQIIFTVFYNAYHGATGFLLAIPLMASLVLAWKKTSRSKNKKDNVIRNNRINLKNIFIKLYPFFTIQILAGALSLSLVFLMPDLLLSRHAPRWIIEGGAHCALVLGGFIAIIPAGYISDKFGVRHVLVVTNIISGLMLFLFLTLPYNPFITIPVIITFGASNASNNGVVVAEGNRLMPENASSISALLMGTPWCLSALAPVIVGFLANPIHGGSPGQALAWMMSCVPAILFFSYISKSSAVAKQPT